VSVRTAYDPGVPCWVDLSSTDVPAAVRFYGELFGWTARMSDDPEAGGYGQFYYADQAVAGVGPVQQEGVPTIWNVYISTDDAAALAARVKDAGGTVVAGPFPVLEQGTMAVFQSPDGSYVSAWQPRGHHGAELVNEPVSFCWNELVTRDVEAATRFYGPVFGWKPHTQDMGGFAYTEWQKGGESIAGMMAMDSDFPAETPSHWATYFAVADLAATISKARDLGAAVLVERMEAPPGPFGMLLDPQGAVFSVIQLHEQA
jgi:uncharacterized protein